MSTLTDISRDYISLIKTCLGKIDSLDNIERCVQLVRLLNVPGEFVEVGGSKEPVFMALLNKIFGMDRTVVVCNKTPLNEDMSQTFSKYGLKPEIQSGKIQFARGKNVPVKSISVIHLDGNNAGEILEACYDKISIGGFVTIFGPIQAANEFREKRNICSPIHQLSDDARYWQKVDESE